MRRLCTDSGCAPSMARPLRACFARPVSFPKKRSCSYSGRSAWHAAGRGYGSRTEGHVERHGVTTRPYRSFLTARPAGDAGRDRGEVSRGHTSRDIQEGAMVKGRQIGRRADLHAPRAPEG
jgi:hypothetical protein